MSDNVKHFDLMYVSNAVSLHLSRWAYLSALCELHRLMKMMRKLHTMKKNRLFQKLLVKKELQLKWSFTEKVLLWPTCRVGGTGQRAGQWLVAAASRLMSNVSHTWQGGDVRSPEKKVLICRRSCCRTGSDHWNTNTDQSWGLVFIT